MRIAQSLFNFYIESSIHVSLGVCALGGINVLIFNLPFDPWVFIFLFTASVTGYNFVKYAGEARFHHRSLTGQLKSIQVFSLICFLVLIYAAFQMSRTFIQITAFLSLFTLFYAFPFSEKHKNLRQLKSLKAFVVAWVWTGAVLFLPLADSGSLWTKEILLTALAYFVFIVALLIPFEIRDLKYDEPGLGTLPQKLGIQTTKILGYILLIVFIILAIGSEPLNTTETVITLVIGLLTAWAIAYSTPVRQRYFTAFWVEAIPVFWLILLWVFD